MLALENSAKSSNIKEVQRLIMTTGGNERDLLKGQVSSLNRGLCPGVFFFFKAFDLLMQETDSHFLFNKQLLVLSQ